MNEVIEVLTVEEYELKNELEKVIDEELHTIESSIETLSRALREYRDKELYRAEYATFEECAANKFNIGRSRAQQLIAYGKTIDALEGLPLPEGYKELPTEGVFRPISKSTIPDDVKREVYVAAVEEAAAEKKPVTGKLIKEKLTELTTEPLPPPPPAVAQKPEYILLLGKVTPSIERVIELLHKANCAKLVTEVYPGCDYDVSQFMDVKNRIEDVIAKYNEGRDE